jgi:hypothetical protein
MKCASDETMTSLGWTLNFIAIIRNVGSNIKAIKKVEITLTVIVVS